MYNKIILIGNLTKDGELKYTTGGTPVLESRLAVNTRFGDKKEEVLFITVTVFAKQAEALAPHLHKGKAILVEGRLQEQKWEKDGQPHSKMVVIADKVRFMGKKDDNGAESGAPAGHDNVPSEVSADLEPF